MRTRKRLLALFFAALLVVPAGGVVAGASAYVSVSGVTVTPEQPAPNDLVTVRATVQNLGSSSSPLTVEKVVLERTNGIDVASEKDLGTLSPGATIEVPLTTSFGNPGTKRLRVNVYGEDENGENVRVNYPVVVQVTDDDPQLDITAPNAVANADTTATVTVSNGLPEDVRNLEVTLDAGGVTVEEPRKVRAALASGQTTDFDFTVNAAAPGDHTLNATLTYTTADGTRRSVDRQATVEFESLRDDVVVAADATNAGKSIAVHVTNRGNAPVTNVTVSALAPDAAFSTAFVETVAPRSTKTVVVNATTIEGDATATVRASYDIGERSAASETTADVSANPATLTLTGLNVEEEDGKLHVTGSASNLGLAAANSVVVSVIPAKGVEPAYPGREYFVGTVPASDFVTFDVYARVDANATSIPLRVTYLADGHERTETVEAPIEGATASTPPDESTDSEGGGWLVPALVGLVVVALVGAAVALAWRNSRGSE
ncbi:CARDB domain-containing protein [Halocalculus aciditolerans]|uniref:CARDB domain-containing protein n=1 Tax=Halocalculus aciditolerans TaxID=1383812 RepID=A0A830F3S6_9EURY|nr:CARDB domain-containing protein [Halocalculus aciditolerans]GGL60455.1 hypothetical protein GCM10009039_18380 [Halocalculus aciditolerans]